MKRSPLFVLFGLFVGRWLSADQLDLNGIDANEDGFIERSEIPAKLIPILSRYASLTEHSLDRPVRVSDLQAGHEAYIRRLQGGNNKGSFAVVGSHHFGHRQGSQVRPFGVAGMIQGTITDQVRRATVERFVDLDINRDGLISPIERASEYRERVASWMRGDQDKNGLLTFAELATAVAAESQRWRIRQARDQSNQRIRGVLVTPEHRAHASRLMQAHDKNKNQRIDTNEIPTDWKNGNMLLWSDENRDGRITQEELNFGSARWLAHKREEQLRKQKRDYGHSQKLASELIRKYDQNSDSVLSSWEWAAISEKLQEADSNGNGAIVDEELAQWLLVQIDNALNADLPDDLPSWFLETDLDLDGQVIMAEYVSAQGIQRINEFQNCDRNSDGIITAMECVNLVGDGKIRFSNDAPRVVEPGGGVRSEILVKDDVVIADVDVQVSILKDGDDDLDLYLVGPDGTMATLYYTSRRKAWGGGRLFDNTIVDDEAPHSSVRLPSPPSHRSFRPQSIDDSTRLSLAAFYGKSAKGTWQMIVSNPAESGRKSAGLLQGWSLLIKEKKSSVPKR